MNFPRLAVCLLLLLPDSLKALPSAEGGLTVALHTVRRLLSACRGCAAPLKRRSNAFEIVKLL